MSLVSRSRTVRRRTHLIERGDDLRDFRLDLRQIGIGGQRPVRSDNDPQGPELGRLRDETPIPEPQDIRAVFGGSRDGPVAENARRRRSAAHRRRRPRPRRSRCEIRKPRTRCSTISLISVRLSFGRVTVLVDSGGTGLSGGHVHRLCNADPRRGRGSLIRGGIRIGSALLGFPGRGGRGSRRRREIESIHRRGQFLQLRGIIRLDDHAVLDLRLLQHNSALGFDLRSAPGQKKQAKQTGSCNRAECNPRGTDRNEIYPIPGACRVAEAFRVAVDIGISMWFLTSCRESFLVPPSGTMRPMTFFPTSSNPNAGTPTADRDATKATTISPSVPTIIAAILLQKTPLRKVNIA